jgi:hypothetical protein
MGPDHAGRRLLPADTKPLPALERPIGMHRLRRLGTGSWDLPRLGVVSALLTTILGFISLVAGTGAPIAGPFLAPPRSSVGAAAGMSMGAVSIYAVLLEIFVVG